MENKTLLIDRNKFCNWYFDYEICKDFFYDQNIMEELKTHGTFTLNLQDILDGLDLIPDTIVAEGQEALTDKWDEVDTSAYDKITFAE